MSTRRFVTAPEDAPSKISYISRGSRTTCHPGPVDGGTRDDGSGFSGAVVVAAALLVTGLAAARPPAPRQG